MVNTVGMTITSLCSVAEMLPHDITLCLFLDKKTQSIYGNAYETKQHCLLVCGDSTPGIDVPTLQGYATLGDCQERYG